MIADGDLGRVVAALELDEETNRDGYPVWADLDGNVVNELDDEE